MTDLTRCFIAVHIDTSIQSALLTIQNEFKQLNLDVKWVNTNNIHLTLKFLGEIPTQELNAVRQIFPSLFKKFSGFEITVPHLGAFPSLIKPKIIWAGVEQNADKLITIAEHVEDALAGLGFAKENKTFSPHLTIGRLKSSKNQVRLTTKLKSYILSPVLSQTVKNIILFQSTLTPQGPIYTPLDRFSLSRKNNPGS